MAKMTAASAAKGDAAVAALLLASAAAAAGEQAHKEDEHGKLLLQQLEQEQQLLLQGRGHAPRSVLIFCTTNQHKLQEAQKILGTEDAVLLSAKMDLFELQSSSLEAIAEAKCKEALYKLQLQWQRLQQHPQQRNTGAPQRVSTGNLLVLTEDTCLCFEALNGLPGPYVKWFLERAGPEGLCKMLHGFENRDAYAVCTLCVVEVNKSEEFNGQLGQAEVKIFQGRTEGSITREPRGPRTFGWDCIFQPDGHSKTFAEMDKETKNSISHRYKAMDQLRAYIRKRNELLKGDQ